MRNGKHTVRLNTVAYMHIHICQAYNKTTSPSCWIFIETISPTVYSFSFSWAFFKGACVTLVAVRLLSGFFTLAAVEGKFEPIYASCNSPVLCMAEVHGPRLHPYIYVYIGMYIYHIRRGPTLPTGWYDMGVIAQTRTPLICIRLRKSSSFCDPLGFFLFLEWFFWFWVKRHN